MSPDADTSIVPYTSNSTALTPASVFSEGAIAVDSGISGWHRVTIFRIKR